jgi:hypothetical protein
VWAAPSTTPTRKEKEEKYYAGNEKHSPHEVKEK